MRQLRNAVAAWRRAQARSEALSRASRLNAALYVFALVGVGLIALEVRQGNSTSRDVISLPRPPTESTRVQGLTETPARPVGRESGGAPAPGTEQVLIEPVVSTTGQTATAVPAGDGGAVSVPGALPVEAAPSAPAVVPVSRAAIEPAPVEPAPAQTLLTEQADLEPPDFLDEPADANPASAVPAPGPLPPLPEPPPALADGPANPSPPVLAQPSTPSAPRIMGATLAAPASPNPAQPSAPRVP